MRTNISTNSAQYKRLQQKANAMAYDDPGKFRIMMSLVDDEFAGEQMRKRILNVSRTTAREGREKTYGLASRRLKSEQSLQGRQTKLEKESAKTARTLGVLNLPLSATFGFMKYKRDVSEANEVKNLMRRLYGETGDSDEFESFTPNVGLSQEEITRTNPNMRRKGQPVFRPY